MPPPPLSDDSGVPDADPSETAPPLDGAGPCATPSECAKIDEERTAKKLEDARPDTAALTAFLTAMPKGGDLHNHLSGAVYAEKYLEWSKSGVRHFRTMAC